MAGGMTKWHVYTVEISAELAKQHTEWTRVRDLDVDWVKVILREDGTAEVFLQKGKEPE